MSSFYDDASLVVIPSGYKTSKVYAEKPTDGSGDLTFTRTGDTATRVNSAGLIEKVRTNLALYSEDFTNAAYIVQNATITANTTTAPNNTNTADTFNEGTLTTAHRMYQQFTITANGEYGFSFYAKKNTLDVIRLVVNDSGENFRWFGAQFDLTNGTITATATGSAGGATYIGGSITNVGNGWYRCSVNGTINTTTALCFVHSSTSTAITSTDDRGGISYTGTNRTFFGWGFQFETGVATSYIATTTAAVSVGPVANVPRLDYLGSTCPRLNLEPQRTNTFTFSEQLDNADWLKLNATITANNTVSPDGYANADRITDDAVNSSHAIYRTGWDTTQRTASVYAKAGTSSKVYIINGTTGTGVFADLSTATFTATGTFTGTLTNVGNGWYRITATHTATGAETFAIGLFTGTSTTDYVGTGLFAYLWGAQLEAGSYATSYINTQNSAVTRGADACSKTGISSLIGQTQGTLFIEFDLTNVNAEVGQIAQIGTGASRVYIYKNLSNSNVYQLATQSASGYNFIDTSAITTPRVKIAIGYKSGDNAFYVNGALVSTASATANPNSFSQFELTNASAATSVKVNQTLLFQTRLTNSELASLTSL